MYLIAGLGNPGSQYVNTRHNIGFRVIDELAARHGVRIDTGKFKGLIGKGNIGGEKIIFVKPMTFMNLSGECIRSVSDFYKIPPENIVIIFDDISLDVGKLRIRKKGSAGGHNGIKSIIAHLGSENFPRLKFGVGDKPAGMDLADYVLGRFLAEDEQKAAKAIENACDAVECMVVEGFDHAMNKYNG